MPSTATDLIDGISSSVAEKAPCFVAATGPIALFGLQTIDGIAVLEGKRVLVPYQADSTQNGIYIASSKTWCRSADFDGARDAASGTTVRIVSGETYEGRLFRLTSPDPIIIGTSPVVWVVLNPDNVIGVTVVQNVFEARALTQSIANRGVVIGAGFDGGEFWRDINDATSAEDGVNNFGSVVRPADYATVGVLKRRVPYLTPEMFGAKADDGNAYTANIQAMLTAAMSKSSAEIILNGSYRHSGGLSIGTGSGNVGHLKIRGEGGKSTVSATQGAALLCDSPTATHLTLNTLQSAEISQVYFGMWSGVTATAGYALVVVGGQRFVMEKSWIDSSFNGMQIDSVSAFSLQNNDIFNTRGNYGLRLTASTSAISTAEVRRLSVIPGRNNVVTSPGGIVSNGSAYLIPTIGVSIEEAVSSIWWYELIVNLANIGVQIGTGATGPGTKKPAFHRFYGVGIENCATDGVLLRDFTHVWLHDLYSALNGQNGLRATSNTSYDTSTGGGEGGPLWLLAARCSGNGYHGISMEGCAELHLTDPQCGSNSSHNAQGSKWPVPIIPVSNTHDGVNISATEANLFITAGRLGGNIKENPESDSGQQRYGLSLESTVTQGRVQVNVVDLNDNTTGPFNDAAGGGVDRQYANFKGWYLPSLAKKTALVNGAFDVSKRGTTFTFGNATSGPDYWKIRRGPSGGSGGYATVTAGGPRGARNYLQIGRLSGDTNTDQVQLCQVLETVDSVEFAGQNVIFYWDVLAGADFSATTPQAIVSRIICGTGTDESALNAMNGTWTGYNLAGGVGQNNLILPGTGFTQFSHRAKIPAGTTQIAVMFYYVPVGTAGAADYLGIGRCAFNFAHETPQDIDQSFSDVLSATEWRYKHTFPVGTAPATGAGVAGAELIILPTGASGSFGETFKFRRMRAAPTVTTFNPAVANANWRDSTNNADRTVAVVAGSVTEQSCVITGAAGVAGSRNYLHIALNAEL